MYLYDKDGSKVKVYNLLPDKSKIYDYKVERMEKVPINKRILYAETNYCSGQIFSNNKAYLLGNQVDYEFVAKAGKLYQKLNYYNMTNEELERQDKLLQSYYNCILSYSKNLIQIYDSNDRDIENLLIIKNYYVHLTSKNGDRYIMNDIINLPRQLYFFEKFANGEFLSIPDWEVVELIKLYNLEGIVKKINNSEIEELSKYKIIDKSELQNKIKKSEKVLKLLK